MVCYFDAEIVEKALLGAVDFRSPPPRCCPCVVFLAEHLARQLMQSIGEQGLDDVEGNIIWSGQVLGESQLLEGAV